MLSFIGLGLYDENDITLKGIEEAKKCEKLYAEFYTSRMGVTIKKIEETIGKKVEILERKDIENGNAILDKAKNMHVGLLTGGDPMAATTHVALRIRAIEMGIKTKVVYGTSVVTASASLLGLQIYKFGRVVTIVKPMKNYFPLSPYDMIFNNFINGLHTLVLLDLQDKPMTANEGMKIMLEMEKRKRKGLIKKDSIIAVVARISSNSEIARAGYIKDLINEDFGPPLHSIVIPSDLHFMEAKALIKIAGAPEEILTKSLH